MTSPFFLRSRGLKIVRSVYVAASTPQPTCLSRAEWLDEALDRSFDVAMDQPAASTSGQESACAAFPSHSAALHTSRQIPPASMLAARWRLGWVGTALREGVHHHPLHRSIGSSANKVVVTYVKMEEPREDLYDAEPGNYLELLGAITHSKSMPRLHYLVDAHQQRFECVHVAAALKQLPKLVRYRDQDIVWRDTGHVGTVPGASLRTSDVERAAKLVAMLGVMLKSHASGMYPRQAANITWALGRLNKMGIPFSRNLLGPLIFTMSKPDMLATHASGIDIAQLLQGLGQLYKHGRQAPSRKAAKSWPRPTHIQRFVDALAQFVTAHPEKLDERDLPVAMRGFTNLDCVGDQKLWAALVVRASTQYRKFAPQAIATIMAAVALAVAGGGIHTMETKGLLVKLTSGVQPQLVMLKPRDIEIMASVCARLQFCNRKLLQLLADKAARDMESFTPDGIANTMDSFSQVKGPLHGFFEAAAKSLMSEDKLAAGPVTAAHAMAALLRAGAVIHKDDLASDGSKGLLLDRAAQRLFRVLIQGLDSASMPELNDAASCIAATGWQDADLALDFALRMRELLEPVAQAAAVAKELSATTATVANAAPVLPPSPSPAPRIKPGVFKKAHVIGLLRALNMLSPLGTTDVAPEPSGAQRDSAAVGSAVKGAPDEVTPAVDEQQESLAPAFWAAASYLKNPLLSAGKLSATDAADILRELAARQLQDVDIAQAALDGVARTAARNTRSGAQALAQVGAKRLGQVVADARAAGVMAPAALVPAVMALATDPVKLQRVSAAALPTLLHMLVASTGTDNNLASQAAQMAPAAAMVASDAAGVKRGTPSSSSLSRVDSVPTLPASITALMQVISTHLYIYSEAELSDVADAVNKLPDNAAGAAQRADFMAELMSVARMHGFANLAQNLVQPQERQ